MRQIGAHRRGKIAHPSEHPIIIPRHNSLRVGTLSAILRDLADHQGLSAADPW
jgi:hypothetical protein